MVDVFTVDKAVQRRDGEEAAQRRLLKARTRLAQVGIDDIAATWDIARVNEAVKFFVARRTTNADPEKMIDEADSLEGTLAVTYRQLLSLLYEAGIAPDDPRIGANPIAALANELDRRSPAKAAAVRTVYQSRARRYEGAENFMRDTGVLPSISTLQDAGQLMAYLDSFANKLGFKLNIGRKLRLIFEGNAGMKSDYSLETYIQELRRALLKFESLMSPESLAILRNQLAICFPGINNCDFANKPDDLIVKTLLQKFGAFLSVPATPVNDLGGNEDMRLKSKTPNYADSYALMHEPCLIVPDMPAQAEQYRAFCEQLPVLLSGVVPTHHILHPLFQEVLASGAPLLTGKALYTRSKIPVQGTERHIHIGDVSSTGFRRGPLQAMTDIKIDGKSGLSGLMDLASLGQRNPSPSPQYAQPKPTFGFALRLAPKQPFPT